MSDCQRIISFRFEQTDRNTYLIGVHCDDTETDPVIVPCPCDSSDPNDPGVYIPLSTDLCDLANEATWVLLEWQGYLDGQATFYLDNNPNPLTAYGAAVFLMLEHFRMSKSLHNALVQWLVDNYMLMHGANQITGTDSQDMWDLYTCIMFTALSAEGILKPSTIRTVLQAQSAFSGSIDISEEQFDAMGELAGIFSLADWNQGVYLVEIQQIYDTPMAGDGITTSGNCDDC